MKKLIFFIGFLIFLLDKMKLPRFGWVKRWIKKWYYSGDFFDINYFSRSVKLEGFKGFSRNYLLLFKAIQLISKKYLNNYSQR
jgi:hypothetical protein